MWILLFFVSCTSLLVEGFGNYEMLGKGRWLVLNIMQCENHEQYEVQVQFSRKKINRTHDAFSFYADLDRELNYTYGMEIIAKKEVDGGFKLYSRLAEASFCRNGKKFIGNIFQQILVKANIDPPDCPLPVGVISFDDFVIDYREIKNVGMYGKYDAETFLTYMGRRVVCCRWLVQFEKHREDADDDDDDDDDDN